MHVSSASHTFRKAGTFLVNVVGGYGPWFWVHFAYSYLLYLVGIVLIVREFFRQHRFYQKQAYWVLAGGILPLLSNLAYVFRIFGPLTKDYSPLMIALSGACFAVGIRKHGLVEFAPLPRDEVYMTLDYPVIVLNAEKRIIDWNEAASRITSADTTPGQRIEEILPTLGPGFPTPDVLARDARPPHGTSGAEGRRRDARTSGASNGRKSLPVFRDSFGPGGPQLPGSLPLSAGTGDSGTGGGRPHQQGDRGPPVHK
jgi:PAS domain-containing protein